MTSHTYIRKFQLLDLIPLPNKTDSHTHTEKRAMLLIWIFLETIVEKKECSFLLFKMRVFNMNIIYMWISTS